MQDKINPDTKPNHNWVYLCGYLRVEPHLTRPTEFRCLIGAKSHLKECPKNCDSKKIVLRQLPVEIVIKIPRDMRGKGEVQGEI